MSYNAKRWVDPVTLKASDLNELEFGVQEAHENLDILNKEVTNITQDQDMMIKKLNDLASGSSDAFAIIKDIESLLQEDKDLADILKVNSENYLSKGTQYLTYLEKQKVLTNLGLDKYKFLETITINGEQVLTDSLHINIPEIDNQLDRNSTNAVANNAIVKALENLGTPDLSRYMNIHNESSTAHSDIRSELNTKATYTYVQNMLSQIHTPDVSGQISVHNLSDTAHQDIRNLIKNIDLSGYSLKDHNHDSFYAPIQHTHPYAAEDHTHNYATPEYVDNKVSSIDISTEINSHNSDTSAHQDIRDAIKNIDLSGYSKDGHTHDDYLPLTAGVDKKVTGSFHVDNYITIANGKGYRAYDSNGTIKELLRLSTGDTIILGDANSNLDIATHGTVRPSAGKLLNLGTATYPWTNIYGTTIYQNGKQVANKEDIPDISNIDLSGYSKIGHKHDDAYAPITHSHDYATPSYVDTAIANLVGAAPDALNTFEELAAALNNNKDILSTFLTKNNPSGTGSLSLNRKANTTIGTNSVALGTGTQATGNSSHAEGYQSKALADYAHAEGYQTAAYGSSHAEGYLTIARNGYAHTEGYNTHAFGMASHAEGGYTYTTSSYAHAEGKGSKSNPYFLVADPLSVSGYYITFALHEDSKNNASHLNIFNAMTRGDLLHISQGGNYYLYRVDSIDLTNQTMVCEAVFYKIDTSLDVSKLTTNTIFDGIAIGAGAHCEGLGTIACGYGQHVFGIGNIVDSNYSNPYRDVVKGDYIEIVGNGTYTSAKGVTKRSNARTLDWDGNEWLAGGLTTEGTITEAGTLLSNKYAAKSHTHTEYSPSSHTHTNYAASSHKHGLVHTDLGVAIATTTTDTGWNMIASELSSSGSHSGFLLKALRTNGTSPNWILSNYAAGIAFGGGDTKGVISTAYHQPEIRFAGGNSNKPSWYMTVTGSSGSTYNLNNFAKVLKGTSSTQSSNATSVSTLRLGLVGSTLYIWTS